MRIVIIILGSVFIIIVADYFLQKITAPATCGLATAYILPDKCSGTCPPGSGCGATKQHVKFSVIVQLVFDVLIRAWIAPDKNKRHILFLCLVAELLPNFKLITPLQNDIVRYVNCWDPVGRILSSDTFPPPKKWCKGRSGRSGCR